MFVIGFVIGFVIVFDTVIVAALVIGIYTVAVIDAVIAGLIPATFRTSVRESPRLITTSSRTRRRFELIAHRGHAPHARAVARAHALLALCSRA